MPTFTLAQKHAELDAHNAKVLARIVRETGGDIAVERRKKILSRLGDEKQLRGIPCVGKECGSGAMRFTKPGDGIREPSSDGFGTI